MAEFNKSELGVIRARKAHFNMTSKGGVHYVPGKRVLYDELFEFAPGPGRYVVYRPGVTPEKALAVIRRHNRDKHDPSDAVGSLKESMGLREGSVQERIAKVYVRDRDARRQCIAKYGARCFICNFSFGERYGKVAKGFIHVHHVRPLSDIGEEHAVDPENLRPVCPNCHVVLHMGDPVFSIEQVKSFLRPEVRRHTDAGAQI